MARLYDIDQRIDELVANSIDPETGELNIDPEQWNALQMERAEKVENIALFMKDVAADADKLKHEIDALTERYRAAQKQAESLKNYLAFALNGEPFKTPRVACSWRQSESVEIEPDDFLPWAKEYATEFLRFKDPEPDKAAIKAALKAGEYVEGAELVKKSNLTVK
jgi:hypothetical protein